MPHNIGEMFYYGDKPWHDLGTRLAKPANLEEALKAGGLDWEVGKVPIVPDGEPNSIITQRRAVVRKDRLPGEKGRVLGVVHPAYQPLQNRQGAKLFDNLIGPGQDIYHTGGYLKHGEVVWLLARFPEDIRVRGEDVLETYLLFSNSHDGSMAIDIRLTTVRVVCNNTLTLALSGTGVGKAFRHAHNGSTRAIEAKAKEFFQFTLAKCKQAEALFTRLSESRCNPKDFQAFLEMLMPDPAKPIRADEDTSVRRAHETRIETIQESREQIHDVHVNGIAAHDISPAEDTWWGALNSVTAWVDHVQKTDNDRYAHNLLGSGSQLKSRAMSRILESLNIKSTI